MPAAWLLPFMVFVSLSIVAVIMLICVEVFIRRRFLRQTELQPETQPGTIDPLLLALLHEYRTRELQDLLNRMDDLEDNQWHQDRREVRVPVPCDNPQS